MPVVVTPTKDFVELLELQAGNNLCFSIITKARKHSFNFVRLKLIYLCNYTPCSGSGNSVGIATDYRVEGPGSNPGGEEISRPFEPALGPTQPPVKWVPVLSRG